MTTTPDLPPVQRSQSLADQAYQSLREGIATGLFEPGERVTERGLASRLGVSPTPVREALRRLEQDGLIERVSARQLRIVEHSPDTLHELLLTGAALRALEARFAAPKITDAALDRMAALIDELAADHEHTDLDFLAMAREFDHEIERAAANATLRGLIESLAIMGEERRARSIGELRTHREAGAERIRGHREILAALRSRDADAVERAFRRQAVSAIELLLADLQDAAGAAKSGS